MLVARSAVRRVPSRLMQAPITKNAIQPLVRSHGADTKKRIQAYEGNVYDFAKAQDKHKFWRYDAGVDGALLDLDKADNELERGKEDYKKMHHLANMFDYAPLMSESKKLLDEVRGVAAGWRAGRG